MLLGYMVLSSDFEEGTVLKGTVFIVGGSIKIFNKMVQYLIVYCLK